MTRPEMRKNGSTPCLPSSKTPLAEGNCARTPIARPPPVIFRAERRIAIVLFNSLEFLAFLPIVFTLYWAVFQRHLKAQSALLLVASYVFYGWWDERFLLLILASTAVDFFAGQRIAAADTRAAAKRWLAVSLVANLGMLGYFKHANFFIASWVDA